MPSRRQRPFAKRPVVWFLAAGALTLIVGSRARSGESADPALATAANARSAASRMSANTPRAELATSADVVTGRGVSLTLHVTNVTDHAIELNFSSGQTHDFIVIDGVGREMWRWSRGKMFTQAVRNQTIAPHETITYDAKWAAAPHAGRFTVIAKLKSSNHPAEERVPFEVKP